MTHGGFNPVNLSSGFLVSKFAFKFNLYRYTAGHFFGASLLQSQLDALEVVDGVVRIAADGDVEQVVAAAADAARRVLSGGQSDPPPASPPGLDPPTLEATVGRFLNGWWARLQRAGLHEELTPSRQIDHVCWRCSTAEEYDVALRVLTSAGHAVAGSSVIGGRTITTVRLSAPVRWREWDVPAIEVPMPKAGRPKPGGFEHAEVALMAGGVRGSEALEALRGARGAVAWDDKGMRKEINPELSVDLGGGCCVKFHNRPLLEVVAYEIAHGLAKTGGTTPS